MSRPIAALALLAAVFSAIDVHAALALLAGAEALWLVAGWLLVQGQIIGSAWRWRMTARTLGQPLDASRAVSEYYLATLVNQTVPGGITGDAARAWRNRGTTASVVLERLAGQVALAAVTLVGILVWPLASGAPLPAAARWLSWMAGALAAVALAVLAWRRVHRARMACGANVAPGPVPLRGRLARAAGVPLEHVRRAWFVDGAWWRQSAISLAIVLAYLALFAVAGRAIGAPLPAPAVLVIVPLTLLGMLLPVSIGGWGVREAAAAALWPLAGLSSESGVATSILYGLLSLAGSLPALWWLRRRA